MADIAVLIDGLEFGGEIWNGRVGAGVNEVSFGRVFHAGNEFVSFDMGRLALDGKSVLFGENP
jgi:hypothetical protein